jgi:hypothetical protein
MTYCKFRSMGTIYAPILNHIIMYWYLTLVIHCFDFITTQGYKSQMLNGMFSCNQNNILHSVYHSPPINQILVTIMVVQGDF